MGLGLGSNPNPNPNTNPNQLVEKVKGDQPDNLCAKHLDKVTLTPTLTP